MKLLERTARQREGRAGFTIVEVVMAMFILLIGVTSILGLLSFGAALSRTAALRSEAAFAIEALVADLQETMFPLVETEDGRVVAGEPVDVENRAVPGRPDLAYSAHAWPEPAGDLPAGPVLYRVDIEIRWSSEGSQRTRRFQTLLKREVPFGERLRQMFVQQKPQKPPTVPPAPKTP